MTESTRGNSGESHAAALKPRWVETGDSFGRNLPGSRWLLVGPLVAEFHPTWWKFGVCFGAWYAGVYLGPLVVTLGHRRFLAPSTPPLSWTVSLDVKKVEPHV